MIKKRRFQVKEKSKKYNKGINRVIIIFGSLLAIFIAMLLVDNYQLISLSKKIISLFKTIAIIISSYFIASIFIKITHKSATNFIKNKDIEQKLIFSKLYTSVIYFIATAFVFWKLGVGLENIALFAGLFATGLAFALREVIFSFFVWLILLVKKPFRIGDHIKIGEEEGIVKHIGTFYVLLDNTPSTFDDIIKVPNKTFMDKAIYNYGSKEVPIKITMNIKPETKDISNKLKKLKDKIDFTEIYREPYLEADDGKLFITVHITSNYDKRTENRTKIIELIMKIMK